MKQRLFSLLCMLVGYCLCISAQQATPQQRKLSIINGLFFSEKPEPFPCGVPMQIGLLKDSIAGKVAIANYDTPLSDEARKLAIPVEEIERGEELLKTAQSARLITMTTKCPSLDIELGDAFPKFKLTDNQGKVWTNRDFKGKQVVLNFWFTGCGPCKREMPELNSWIEKYPNVLFVAVTFQSAADIEKVITEKDFRFHQLIDAQSLLQKLGVKEYPTTMVLDTDSKLQYVEIGTTPIQRKNILRQLKP
ncbi:MAG: TlpA family protein disulfide reductase [Bacteroides sp.]|nr:TlpA family protein disulfide reductase [Bacteroides sp.]